MFPLFTPCRAVDNGQLGEINRAWILLQKWPAGWKGGVRVTDGREGEREYRGRGGREKKLFRFLAPPPLKSSKSESDQMSANCELRSGNKAETYPTNFLLLSYISPISPSLSISLPVSLLVSFFSSFLRCGGISSSFSRIWRGPAATPPIRAKILFLPALPLASLFF